MLSRWHLLIQPEHWRALIGSEILKLSCRFGSGNVEVELEAGVDEGKVVASVEGDVLVGAGVVAGVERISDWFLSLSSVCLTCLLQVCDKISMASLSIAHPLELVRTVELRLHTCLTWFFNACCWVVSSILPCLCCLCLCRQSSSMEITLRAKSGPVLSQRVVTSTWSTERMSINDLILVLPSTAEDCLADHPKRCLTETWRSLRQSGAREGNSAREGEVGRE